MGFSVDQASRKPWGTMRNHIFIHISYIIIYISHIYIYISYISYKSIEYKYQYISYKSIEYQQGPTWHLDRHGRSAACRGVPLRKGGLEALVTAACWDEAWSPLLGSVSCYTACHAMQFNWMSSNFILLNSKNIRVMYRWKMYKNVMYICEKLI